MKIFLKRLMAVALGLGISLAGVSPALATNLTWSADHTVALTSPAINLTIASGSKADSLVVGTGNVILTVANGDSFTISSADRQLDVTGKTTATVTATCVSGVSQLVIAGGSGGETLTVTPNLIACSGGSGGGSGGGGTTKPKPPVVTPPVTPPTTGTAHSMGSVVKTSDGTVWFITTSTSDGMTKRYPFTSAGAFLSYKFFSFSQVTAATSGDIALPAGNFIGPRDGSIFCATATKGSDVKGECSLITAGMKASFTSQKVFSGQGFSFNNAQYGDSSFLTKTTNISSATEAHRPGVLVNNKGTVQFVGTSVLVGIPSVANLTSWGYSMSEVVPANAADKLLTQTGVLNVRGAGELEPMGY